jgi:hypothetical protein
MRKRYELRKQSAVTIDHFITFHFIVITMWWLGLGWLNMKIKENQKYMTKELFSKNM